MDRKRETIYVNSTGEVVRVDVTHHVQKKLVTLLVKRESKTMISISRHSFTPTEAATLMDTINFMSEKNTIILEDPLAVIDVKKVGDRIDFSIRRQRGKMMRQVKFNLSDEEAEQYSKLADSVLYGEDSD